MGRTIAVPVDAGLALDEATPMTYPAFDTSGIPGAEHHDGPVTCASCGCRLQSSAGGQGWVHYLPMAGRDARGCQVDCADAVHDSRGRAAGA